MAKQIVKDEIEVNTNIKILTDFYKFNKEPPPKQLRTQLISILNKVDEEEFADISNHAVFAWIKSYEAMNETDASYKRKYTHWEKIFL